jgi:hypothetical protein
MVQALPYTWHEDPGWIGGILYVIATLALYGIPIMLIHLTLRQISRWLPNPYRTVADTSPDDDMP